MKRVVVFFVLAMVVISSSAAQSTAADAQRIVGSWTQGNGHVWVFNANGTGSRDGVNFYFGISTSGLIRINYEDRWNNNDGSIFFSPDGRRVIIFGIILQRN